MKALPLLCLQPPPKDRVAQPPFLVALRVAELLELACQAEGEPRATATRTEPDRDGWWAPAEHHTALFGALDVTGADQESLLYPTWRATTGMTVSVLHVAESNLTFPPCRLRTELHGGEVRVAPLASGRPEKVPSLPAKFLRGLAPALAQTEADLTAAVDALIEDGNLSVLEILLRHYREGPNAFFGRPLRTWFPDRLPSAPLASLLEVESTAIREAAVLALSRPLAPRTR